MGKHKLRGKDLSKIHYTSDKTRSLAMDIMAKHYKYNTKAEKLELLKAIRSNPEAYLEDEVLAVIAQEFVEAEEEKKGTAYDLLDKPKEYAVYGRPLVDSNTFKQMDTAMRLPIAAAGALMPDAHVGYGLPVGGVLATENAVIPYGVGLDIGCRMCLSIFEASDSFLKRNHHLLKTSLGTETRFGIGKGLDEIEDHEVLDRPEFNSHDVLRRLHGKAVKQIGTSGSGNHFVEFGTVEIPAGNQLGLEPGNYLGLLSHSGSRGFGATIAQYYTQAALDTCKLPQGARHLAWLDLDSEAGQEYWIAMNLAGDYAKACHDVIHRRLARKVGLKPLLKVENHHNFAWRELQPDGRSLVVHRKGATPAKEGELGIIPGSMTAPGYIVSGKGEANALASASHGAGRKLSRKKAKSSITGSDMRKKLKNHGVTLIGGGIDEAPMAYKDLEQVMARQQDLVRVEGKFYPKIVRMDKN